MNIIPIFVKDTFCFEFYVKYEELLFPWYFIYNGIKLEYQKLVTAYQSRPAQIYSSTDYIIEPILIPFGV